MLVAVLFCFSATSSHAQLIPGSQWAVFRQADGLLASDLYTVFPTAGVVWFGGRDGVSRFDGTWTHYPLDSSATQTAAEDSANIVTAVAFDGDRNLLAGTQDGRLLQMVDGKWLHLQHVGARIQTLRYFAGAIWVGTNSGLFLIEGGEQRALAPLQGTRIDAIQPTSDMVWIGAENGLWQVTPDATTIQPYSTKGGLTLPQGAVTTITQGTNGALWLGLDSAIVRLHPSTGLFRVYRPFELAQNAAKITSIGVSADETVWVATDNSGVVKYTFQNGKQVSATNYDSRAGSGLDTDNVRNLAIDTEGAIWFATQFGAFRHYPWAWMGVGDEFSGLPISDLAVDASGSLWLATDGEGVIRFEYPQGTRTEYYPGLTDLANASIPQIEAADDGRIWAATLSGVSVFADGRWQNPIDADDLPSVEVYAVAADTDGLWIGTGKGLARYSFVEQTTTVEPELAGQALRDLQTDGAGRLWALTEDGSLHVRLTSGNWMPERDITLGLTDAAQISAMVTPSAMPGIAFAAVENEGIFRWNGYQWQQYGPRNEWLDGHIFALKMGANGQGIWIGSNIGIGRIDEVGLTIYDARDGAAGGAIHSIEPAEEGGYWFGGQKGLWRFKSEPSAPVLRSGAIVGGSKQSDSTWQAFTDRQLSLNFETGDIHTASDRIQVFYRISSDGQVGKWQTARGRSLPLTFAAPGVYGVELVARDLSFNYSSPLQHTITVFAPPVTVAVPVLGTIEVRVFGLMLVFAASACVGLGYVAYEYVGVRRRASIAVRRGFNPYVSGEPVRRADMFFGRHDLVARISATLHNNSIMIHGERRIGKTTLLYQLANLLCEVQDKAYWFLPVYVDMEGTAETELFHLLMEEILSVVSDLPALSIGDKKHIGTLQYWVQRDPSYDDRVFGRDLRTLMTILEEYAQVHQQGRQVRLILLMDEMDTLSRFDRVYQQQLRRIFMRDFAATLGAVVAGIELSKDWDRVESPWFNLFNEIEIQPLPRDAATELLVKPVQNYYRYDADALQFILMHSEGRPFRLQQYALESVNHMLRQHRRRITMADVIYAHNLVQSEQNTRAAQAGLTQQVMSGESSRSAPALFSPT